MKPNGFTLAELLVSLFIFSLISAAAVALVSFSTRAQALTNAGLEALGAIRRADALLASDLGQAAPRSSRDEAGDPKPAFSGGFQDGRPLISLVRRGWEGADVADRSSLQKVDYSFAEGELRRTAYPYVDGAAPARPVTLMTGIHSLTIRFRDRNGEWRERWNPTRPGELPRAVELVVDRGSGPVRQLFLVGASA
jgi:general secretion pathway protein J